jgi:hypothetical protein
MFAGKSVLRFELLTVLAVILLAALYSAQASRIKDTAAAEPPSQSPTMDTYIWRRRVSHQFNNVTLGEALPVFAKDLQLRACKEISNFLQLILRIREGVNV